jgi:hypothetical protein
MIDVRELVNSLNELLDNAENGVVDADELYSAMQSAGVPRSEPYLEDAILETEQAYAQ